MENMNSINPSFEVIIGNVSAYAIAREHGYVGTEEQWAEEIANASQNAQSAAASAAHVDEVADSIPEDYTTLSNDVSDLKSAFETNLYENIAPWPYSDGMSKTVNGITYTVQNDGSIIANGTATANASFYIISSGQNKKLPVGTYVLSGNPDGYGNDTYVFCGVANPQGAGDILSLQNKTDPVSASVSAEGVVRLFVMVRSGKTVSNIVFKPMLQRGKIATNFISPNGKSILNVIETDTIHRSSVHNIFNANAMVSPYDDLDTFPPNEYCLYQLSNTKPANAPQDVNFANGVSIISFNSVNAEYGTVQILFDYGTAGMWYRMSWGAPTWKDWKRASDLSVIQDAIENTVHIGAKTFITSVSSMTAPYDDLNTFPSNEYCLYQMSGSGPANIPIDVNVAKGISVFSYNPIKETVNGTVQLLIQNDGDAYWRIGWNNGFREWMPIGSKREIDALKTDTKNIVAHTEFQRGYTFDDISGATSTDASGWMSKYAYSAGFVEKLRIKVTDSTSGYVLVVGANTETVLFISSVSASEAGLIDIPVNAPINEPFYVGIRLAKTAYISSSSEPQYDYSNSIPGTSLLPTTNVGQKLDIAWKSNMRIYLAIEAFYSDAAIAAISGMPSVSEYSLAYATFGMFPTFGVVGDSYASGEIFRSSSSATDSYYLSWGQTIARKCGVKCTNYSQGGMDTHRFVTYGSHNPGSLAKLLADDPLHMYLLVLGINDPTNNGGISYLGALTDITSHESYADYPDTFYGNYGKIIEQIQAHAPDAKLIMVTTAYTDSVRVQFNAAIEEIAKHYGLPCMVQLENEFLNSKLYWNTMYYGHPTAVTYSAMAMAFAQMFGKCAYDYYEYFKDFILPTDYVAD